VKCEYCNGEHDGTYGSGRFCSRKCANGFSTKEKRTDINRRVSQKLKGRKPTAGGFRKGHINFHVLSKEDQEKIKLIRAEKRKERLKNLPFEDFPNKEKRKIVLEEQRGKCAICEISEWNGLKIVLEFHHRDGNGKNEKRENLVFLCPNCHSQTNNYRKRRIDH